MFLDERKRRSTCDHDELCHPERVPLSIFQAGASDGIEADGRGKRLMHERNDSEARGLACNQLRHCAERETVNQSDCFLANGGERAAGMLQRCWSRGREAGVELDGIHTPTLPLKAFPNTPVVDVTAGPCLERTGRDDHD